jgi:peptide/nickel transport system permease protein
MSRARGVWAAGMIVAAATAILAPWLALNAPSDQFRDRAYAPPMRVHLRGVTPCVYPQVLKDRLMREYADDRTTCVPLTDRAHGPVLLLGADALGRDVFSRLLYGAQLSLGVAALGALGAIAFGAIIGGLAGSLGGWPDRVLMLLADFIIVLPGVYLVLVLRAALPQVLTTREVFWLMAGLFAVAAWPHVARGVRAIVAVERTRDYAEAARAAGAGRLRLLRHLLPAARGFLAVEILLLVPALLVAEATISYLGLGFPEPIPSWGTMLQDAANVSGMNWAPWLLAPAGALFGVMLIVQGLAGKTAYSPSSANETPARL